ncbi:MAG: dihydroorotase [Capnocytophaga sp.]|nr:dihydroorotase [Capnocytophaga sp.]
MKIFLKSVTILDCDSQFHKNQQDIRIENGIIKEIGSNLNYTSEEKVIENCFVSQGWADSSVCFGEPGYEERETLDNGMRVAAKSGFTQIMLNPNVLPITDTKSQVAYLKQVTQNSVNELFPIGALSVNSQGEYLAELYDMAQGGAVAFGDYKKSLYNANLLKIALQYTQPFQGIVISFANEKTIAGKGVVNEHITSTKLGLKGIPTLAEEVVIARDLAILEYSGGKLHIPTVSSAKSLEIIKEAKRKGLDVTCSVAIYNLHLPDDILVDFNTNYKVLPPLRDKIQIEALCKGLEEGVIDFVTSDHCPLDIECKAKEFDLADFGTIGLETAFGILIQHVSVEKAVQLLTGAKKRFSLPSAPIEVGNEANLTLFRTEGEYVLSEKDITSTSKNCAFLGEKIKGSIIGIITQKGFLFN